MQTDPSDHAPAPQLPANPLSAMHARAARTLVGWLPAERAHVLLAGPGVAPPYAQEIVERATNARAMVAQRKLPSHDIAVITDVPTSEHAYVEELESQPFYKSFIAERWRVATADLRYVRAIQPTVHSDHALDRTASAAADDFESLAKITIPLARPKEFLAIEPSPDGRRWTLTCRNPMLRVMGPYQMELVDEHGYKTNVFGFQTEIANSLVQVARWRGIYLLRDGYHRTHGLLSRGITSVPVIYREFPDNEIPLFAPGLLDPAVYLSDRAPMLTDLLDDTVSASIEVRKLQKTFVIQALEMDIPQL